MINSCTILVLVTHWSGLRWSSFFPCWCWRTPSLSAPSSSWPNWEGFWVGRFGGVKVGSITVKSKADSDFGSMFSQPFVLVCFEDSTELRVSRISYSTNSIQQELPLCPGIVVQLGTPMLWNVQGCKLPFMVWRLAGFKRFQQLFPWDLKFPRLMEVEVGYFMQLFNGFYTSQLVQEFFHQQYEIIIPQQISGGNRILFQAQARNGDLPQILRFNLAQAVGKSAVHMQSTLQMGRPSNI